MADGDWADVADAEEDAEGGWGVGPAEASQMLRDEMERQAKHKTYVCGVFGLCLCCMVLLCCCSKVQALNMKQSVC